MSWGLKSSVIKCIKESMETTSYTSMEQNLETHTQAFFSKPESPPKGQALPFSHCFWVHVIEYSHCPTGWKIGPFLVHR